MAPGELTRTESGAGEDAHGTGSSGPDGRVPEHVAAGQHGAAGQPNEPGRHDEPGQHGGPGAEVDVPEELPVGAVRALSGRVSAATEFQADEQPTTPFSSVQLSRLDEALTLVSRHTQLRFSLYLGDLGEDSRAGALALHDKLGPAGVDAVLIAVDPNRRTVDIVTGPEARLRLADRSCKLAVMSMVASFKEGDLLGGLLSGLRMLSDQAGIPHHAH
jgi:hypothetical protein